MKKEIEKIIKANVSMNDFNNALNHNCKIFTPNISRSQKGEEFSYFIRNEDSYYGNRVYINIKDKTIVKKSCDCTNYYRTGTCIHIAAVLVKEHETIFRKSFETEEEKSKRILEIVKSKVITSSSRKEEVFLIPMLVLYYDSYDQEWITQFKVKIGTDKKYILGSKSYYFIKAYEKDQSYRFGKNFTYDPSIHYLSQESKQIISFIKSLNDYSRDIYLDSDQLDSLFNICKDKIFVENLNKNIPIIKEFPFTTKLSKDSKKYILNIEKDLENAGILTDNYKYVYFKNNIYSLNSAQQALLENCIVENIDKLTIDNEDFNSFQESIIPIIKEKIETDETTKDIVIIKGTKIKLYFDILENEVICNPKFLYNNDEISFFDKSNNIIRDIESENNVEQALYEYKFEKGKKSYALTSLDDICYLIEHGFNELANSYEVYTSEKLKNTNIIKNNNISSTFSIGQDNILRYTFDLGEINPDELNNIMKSMNNNKKYYRLKSGDIISLEEESINELRNLCDDLDLSSDLDINGEIPKYRALYLDFLKENKYGIIKTDSLFQKFIDQFNEYKNNDLAFTKEEKNVLRDYQVEGVKWLYTIKKCGFGGILADEMGLGKSIQTIYFIKKLIEENSDSKHLIICPTSLIYNWENEFKKFAPDLKFKVIAGTRQSRINLFDSYDGNIYITTYGLLREDSEYYDDIDFETCVIDEAQNIKNPKTGLTKAVKKIKSVTKIALTGTPIENSITELWSIFDYMMPGFLSNLMAFQNKYKIRDVDEDNNVIDTLKRQVKPFILRRKKKDVISDLPEKIENNIFIDLSEEQKKIYAAEVKYVQEEMQNIIGNGGFKKNQFLILKLLTRLRQICIDPSILYKDYKGESNKIETLISLLKEVTDNGHKVLLFTSFKTALEIVKKELDKEDISNYTIAGDVSSKTRQQLVDAFNKDNTKVFLIMLKSGGTGLNLTSADVVIHLDLWWNPQVENQATDRAHRIGQKNTVEVIKLICKGTIEERILELQDKKKILSEKLLEKDMDDAKYINQLNEDDIKNLITYNND